jgi:mRNA interferase MazF
VTAALRGTALRGEIWQVNFAGTQDNEQTGVRPALVISSDDYNRGPAGLVVVCPITRAVRGVPWHVPLARGEGGLEEAGVILCDHVRSVSTGRFLRQRGAVSFPVLEEVGKLLKYLFELP